MINLRTAKALGQTIPASLAAVIIEWWHCHKNSPLRSAKRKCGVTLEILATCRLFGYALEITTDDVHVELNKIRKIRNAFAHTKDRISLDTEPVKSIFYKLKRPTDITGSYLEQFVRCGLAVDDHLEAYLVSVGETEDLRALKKPTETIEQLAREKEPPLTVVEKPTT